MNIFDKLLSLLAEGTYGIMVPLIAICLVLWMLIVERCHVLFGPIWLSVWPPARRLQGLRRSELLRAVDELIEQPTIHNCQAVVRWALSAKSPYSMFLLRVLGGVRPLHPSVRDLELSQAALTGTMEIERGLGLISVLSKAAPLVGLLGTVTGMIQTFTAMMVASTSDPRALSSGVSMALIATEVGLVVALPGVMGMTWLSRRAQRLEEEIHLVSMRLRQIAPGALQEAQP